MKLPKGWSNFKIIETTEGCLTGQVRISGDKFEIFDRELLNRYTKEFIEERCGINIEQYKP